jgi:putative transposase
LDRFELEFFAVFSLAGKERGDEPKAGAANASRFTDAQKAFVIKQGEEGVPVAEVCRKAGISQATYFAWKKKYAGLMPSEMRRLKQLEEENSRLKRIVADLSLDKEMLQDIVRRKL